MSAPSDREHLRRALRLAVRGRYRTSPNPMVGAVVVRDDAVVGEGFHRRVGGPHAEVEALAAAGERSRGATLYVTLEPCCHHGRTPPCVDKVLEAGVTRVVACHRDPDPRVGGEGFARLREAGVEAETGILLEQAVELNWRYLVARLTGRPAVTLKWAMSLDGKIATRSGDARWISSPRGRRWSLELREEHDALVVGIGTVLADDPRLDRRLAKSDGPNLRVILDRRLRLPPGARLWRCDGPVLVVTESADCGRRRALEARGAKVLQVPEVTPGAVLGELAAREVQSVLVEGGGEVHAAFVASGLFDRVAASCAPLVIGGREAPGAVGGEGVAELSAAPRLDCLRTRRRGEDLIITGFREGCLRGLSASVGG
jgi:diaminohydroxyphosphoribosylaminopyrimidine deaminase/5-amino-6-(5-phosphoribosylamino)uracil reductase